MSSSKHNRTYSQYFISNQAYATTPSLLQQLQTPSDPFFPQQTLEDIRSVLSQDYPPSTKILSIKLLKDIFLLGKQNLISLVQNIILPEVVAVVLYKDSQQGAGFFSETNFYKSANQRQREDFRSQGIEYVALCKESVAAWANLMPFTNEGHPSRFSEKYSELVKRGVVFPRERRLYHENDREVFSKSYKVQFFNEDSSMSDSFLTESNCVNLIERELSQCDQLEDMLRNTLKPGENQTDWGKFKTIMERINIFFHETSVKMLQEIKSINMPKEYSNKVLGYQSRFGQIAEDYEYLKSHKMRYVNFYQLYGYKLGTPQKQGRMSFSPSESVINAGIVVPEIDMRRNKVSEVMTPVEGYRESFEPIALGGKRGKKMTASVIQSSNQIGNQAGPSLFYQEKRTQQEYQKDLLFEAKKQSEIQDFYATKLKQQKQQYEFRIQELKKQMSYAQNNNPLSQQKQILRKIEQQSEPLHRKIIQLNEDLKQSQIQRQKLKTKNKYLENQLSETQRQYHEKDIALKKILQDTERFKSMNNNYEEKIQYLQKQVQKQSMAYEKLAESNRISQVSEMSNKKLEKKLQNTLQQKQLLKQQLTNQRSRKYEHISNQTKLLKEEIERLKSKIKSRDEEAKEAIMKFDLSEVDNLKLKQQLKIKATFIESLKKQNERMNLTLKEINLSERKPEQAVQMVPSMSQISGARLDIKDYLEVGMEGLVYYDVLSKEFRVKYKRSCFKKKQLLYKQNNIEIGVITEVTSFNTISCTMFLTNYGTKSINNIRLKVLNPTSNQIELDTNSIPSLNQGQQQKVFIQSSIHQYPIGPVVLKLEYPGSNLEETSQLLIPISIIKLVRGITRHNPFLKEYNNVQLKYDHRMIQNLGVLKDYFPNVEFKVEGASAVLHMTMIHDHTRTEWDMDLEVDNDYLNIRWAQVSSGYEEIQGYYCKTLWNLLSK